LSRIRDQKSRFVPEAPVVATAAVTGWPFF
jgi:hypothetical protein